MTLVPQNKSQQKSRTPATTQPGALLSLQSSETIRHNRLRPEHWYETHHAAAHHVSGLFHAASAVHPRNIWAIRKPIGGQVNLGVRAPKGTMYPYLPRTIAAAYERESINAPVRSHWHRSIGATKPQLYTLRHASIRPAARLKILPRTLKRQSLTISPSLRRFVDARCSRPNVCLEQRRFRWTSVRAGKALPARKTQQSSIDGLVSVRRGRSIHTPLYSSTW